MSEIDLIGCNAILVLPKDHPDRHHSWTCIVGNVAEGNAAVLFMSTQETGVFPVECIQHVVGKMGQYFVDLARERCAGLLEGTTQPYSLPPTDWSQYLS